jgi:hypothetical protein
MALSQKHQLTKYRFSPQKKQIETFQISLKGLNLVLVAGLEPARPEWTRDFKS